MNLSGILVMVPAEHLGEAKILLAELPGVDVHHEDPEKGRIVVTLEADTVEDEVEGLQRIKALPPVVAAEMVYHYFEGNNEPDVADTVEQINRSG